MRYFDPHIHCYSRTTDDYERMSVAGVRVVVEPAFWLGSERTHPQTHFDYFEHVLTFEPKRAAQYGIDHYCCLAMNPKESKNLEVAHQVIDGLPEYLKRDRCLALGEIGFDLITPAEEEIMRRQLHLAKDLGILVMVHIPHTNKRVGTERTIELLNEVGLDPNQVILDHNNSDTIDLAVEYGGFRGMTIYPGKVSIKEALDIMDQYGTEKMMINTAADWGPADPLNVAKTAMGMRKHGYSDEQIEELVWHNPIQFYRQSGKLGEIN